MYNKSLNQTPPGVKAVDLSHLSILLMARSPEVQTARKAMILFDHRGRQIRLHGSNAVFKIYGIGSNYTRPSDIKKSSLKSTGWSFVPKGELAFVQEKVQGAPLFPVPVGQIICDVTRTDVRKQIQRDIGPTPTLFIF